MHETDGVEFATTRLATDVSPHYAEQGDGAGEAVIFLHGYSESLYSFSRMLPLLSAELQPVGTVPNPVCQLPNTSKGGTP